MIRACVLDPPTHPPTHPSLFLMKIHPPTRRINTFTNLAETDIVNFTPSGKNNGMSNRSRHTRRKQTFSTLFQNIVNFTPNGKNNGMSSRTRHTRRKQTLSTLFQGEVTSDRPRLTRALSAETDISTLHKNPCQHCFSWK